jgi:hypothetical protein
VLLVERAQKAPMVLVVSVFMNDLIKSELVEVIRNWADGRRIHAIPLGHPVRVVTDPNGYNPREERHVFRQKRAYDYCFTLIAAGLEHSEPPRPFAIPQKQFATPVQSPKFEALTWELFMLLTSSAPPDLSTEERQAAESLAWKALNRGWNRALSGFPAEHEIMLAREADA